MPSEKDRRALIHFQLTTPICGNCQFEKRDRIEIENRTARTCKKHIWPVVMSGTCNDHQYRNGRFEEKK